MNPDSIQITIGLIGLIVSIVIATVQTVRIRSLRKIRDTHLNLIWHNAKRLSSWLLTKTEEECPREACGVASQRTEEMIATLVVNLFNLDRKKIKRWCQDGEIDDYDLKIMMKLTRR